MTSPKNPFVRLFRDPVVEARVNALGQQRPQPLPLIVVDMACFICGEPPQPYPSPSLQLQQTALFKQKYFPFGRKDDHTSCAECSFHIRQVWNLHQQIQDIVDKLKLSVKKKPGPQIVHFVSDVQAIKVEDAPAVELDFDNDFEMVHEIQDFNVSLLSEQDEGDFYPNPTLSDSDSDSKAQAPTPAAQRPTVISSDSELKHDVEAQTPAPTSQRPSRISKSKAAELLKKIVIKPDKEEDGDSGSDMEDFSGEDSEDSSDHDSDSDQEKAQSIGTQVHSTKRHCSFCEKSFRGRKRKLVHEILHHGLEMSEEDMKKNLIVFYQCESCPYKTPEKCNFKRHIASHKDYRPHFCTQCDKAFSTDYSRRVHEATKHGSLTKAQFRLLQRRKRRKENEAKKLLLKCPKCPKRFSDEKAVSSHMSCHGKKVNCNICGKTVAKESLTKHMKYIHKNAKSFFCKECDNAGFTYKVQLNKHMATVHSTPHPKPEKIKKAKSHYVICEVPNCDQSIAYSSLRTHIRNMHSSIINCTCDQCGKGFYFENDLAAHIQSEHDKTPPTLEQICELCGKLLKDQRTLDEHRKRVHEQVKPFPCSKCTFRFCKKSELARHELRTHSDKQVYPCTKCGTNFKQHHFLRQHQKRWPHCDNGQYKFRGTTADNPESCLTCNLHFPMKSYMNKHLRDVHPELWDFDKRIRKCEVEQQQQEEEEDA